MPDEIYNREREWERLRGQFRRAQDLVDKYRLALELALPVLERGEHDPDVVALVRLAIAQGR